MCAGSCHFFTVLCSSFFLLLFSWPLQFSNTLFREAVQKNEECKEISRAENRNQIHCYSNACSHPELECSWFSTGCKSALNRESWSVFCEMKYAYKIVWFFCQFSKFSSLTWVKIMPLGNHWVNCVSNSVLENQVLGFTCSFLRLFCIIFLFSSMFSPVV